MKNVPDTNDSFSRPRRWNAHWIWGKGERAEKNVYYYFRKEIEVLDNTDGYRLFIAADTRYQLFINGEFVGRGAPIGTPNYQYYDEYNLSGYLRKGNNCIAVIVYHLGTILHSRGGLLTELVDEKGRTTAATDESWKVARARAWSSEGAFFHMNKVTPFQEFFDARKTPEGWTKIGFDDSAWSSANVIKGRMERDKPPATGPWSLIVPRDIPHMTADPVLPVKIERVDENLGLANRKRSEDLSIVLSMTGGPITHTRVENADNLCREKGDTVIQCSASHLDPSSPAYYDGIYEPAIVLDFGKVISAYIEIKLDGVDGGMVDIGYAERLIDGQFNNALEGMFADRLTMKDGEQTYLPFTWKGFRYVKLRFHECCTPVKIHSVRAIISTYPFEERGTFESSDEKMNGIFEISRATIRLCCNEFITDTPWREQGQWLGDVAAVTVPAIYACFGDPRLPGKFFRQAAQHQFRTGLLSNVSNDVWPFTRCIPDYSLWWVIGLWRHYLYTGETKWINELYPVACRVIQAHLNYVNERGLIENIPFSPLMEWAALDRRGETAANSALFYGTLETFGKMAEFKHDEYMISKAHEVRNLTHTHFQKRFFELARGCLADACIDGTLSPKVSEHSNFAAILWDLVDAETAQSIIRKFYEEKTLEYTEAQPFYMVVVLNALDKAGRFDLALELIRERWGRRMVDKGATSCFEEWTDNGSWRDGEFKGFMRSHSHAWSSCPAEFLIRNLIGLEILEPGCRKVRLLPHETSFDYTAAFPTPLGTIEVKRKDGKTGITVPEEIKSVEE